MRLRSGFPTVRYVTYNIRRFRTPEAARAYARSVARSYDYCQCTVFEDVGSFFVVSECHVVRIESSGGRLGPTRTSRADSLDPFL